MTDRSTSKGACIVLEGYSNMSTMENKLQHTSDTIQTFTLRSLQDVTSNFSEEHIIGRGGYGVVYKGVLHSGEEIALKKLHCIPGLDDWVFKNEFSNLMKARHKNITRLVGYCYHKGHSVVEVDGVPKLVDVEERVLCIEYLQSGGLDKYISDESRGLDWCTRYKIIKGVCEGLNYLHNGYKDPIYHMDLKPANILLDKDMTPKIGDFGLSRLFPPEHTFSTTKAIGTPGYMPPEYIEKCQITSKFDVFSLGVIIIRIVAGDEGYSKCADMSSEEFIEHVHENWRKRLLEMMTSHTSEEVITCIKIALRCVEVDRVRRPSISEIVIELNKIGTIKCSPINEERHAFKGSDEELIEDQYSSGESFVTCPSSLASSLSFSSLQTPARPRADYDFLVKLLLVGDSSVGKSKLLLRFSDTSFATSFITTIDIDFKIRTLELDGKSIKLYIWDTAGQERFRTITTAYYRGATGILLVYDVTDESSFNNIRRWKRNIEQHAAPDVNMILVGNITDLDESKRAVTTSRGQALAYEYGINFFETCAKTNLNVDQVFFSLAREIIQRLQRPKTDYIPKDPAPESKQRHKGPLGFARELFSKKKEG